MSLATELLSQAEARFAKRETYEKIRKSNFREVSQLQTPLLDLANANNGRVDNTANT